MTWNILDFDTSNKVRFVGHCFCNFVFQKLFLSFIFKYTIMVLLLFTIQTINSFSFLIKKLLKKVVQKR